MEQSELQAERERIAAFIEVRATEAQQRILASRKPGDEAHNRPLELAAHRVRSVLEVLAEMVRTGYYEHISKAPTDPAPPSDGASLKVKVIVEPSVTDRVSTLLTDRKSLVTTVSEVAVSAKIDGRQVWLAEVDGERCRGLASAFGSLPNMHIFSQPLGIMLHAALGQAEQPALFYVPGCDDADYELIKAHLTEGSRIIRSEEELYADA